MVRKKFYEYYEREGKSLTATDVDRYYRGVFRFFSTHGCRTVILDRWLDSCRSNQKFLDVGCELGYFVRKLAGRGLEARGIDLSPTKIGKARRIAEKLGVVCDFSVMDAENLQFEDNSFDWVLCSETLEHVPNDQAAIREIVRVSKENIIITVPLKSPFWHVLNNFSTIYGLDDLGAGHLREYTEQSLLKLLDNQVQVQEIQTGGYLTPFLDKILPNLSLFRAILCVKLKKKKH